VNIAAWRAALMLWHAFLFLGLIFSSFLLFAWWSPLLFLIISYFEIAIWRISVARTYKWKTFIGGGYCDSRECIQNCGTLQMNEPY
jgi:hypothetical protein